MKITHNTILITGGASGIGFELSKQLAAKGNKIIITGRDQAKVLDHGASTCTPRGDAAGADLRRSAGYRQRALRCRSRNALRGTPCAVF